MLHSEKKYIGATVAFGITALFSAWVAGNLFCFIPAFLLGVFLSAKGKYWWVLSLSAAAIAVAVLLKEPYAALLFACTLLPCCTVAAFGKKLSFDQIVWLSGGLFALGGAVCLIPIYTSFGGVLSLQGLQDAVNQLKELLSTFKTVLPDTVDTETVDAVIEEAILSLPGWGLFLASSAGFSTALFVAANREGVRPVPAQVTPQKISALVYVICTLAAFLFSVSPVGITGITLQLALTPLFLLFGVFTVVLRVKAGEFSLMRWCSLALLVLFVGVLQGVALMGAIETLAAVKNDRKKE